MTEYFKIYNPCQSFSLKPLQENVRPFCSDMMRVVLAQYVVTLIAALFCTAVFGTDPGLSAFLGGFYYAAATTLHALILLGVKKLGCGVGANVVTLLFGEFVKVLCVILLLFITAQLYANLNWPALIISLMAVANSYFILLFKKR